MGKLNIFLNFFYILLFISKEIKNLFLDFKRIFTVYFRYYNILKLIYFKINKNVNPSNNKLFINFINKNKKLWDKKNKENRKNRKKILVTSFVHFHPAYPYANSIIGKYLEEYYNSELLGFCDNYDLKSEIIMRSFGIKKFYYLYERNFFVRFFYFLLALRILKNIKNINKFLKFRYNNIDIGKIVYEDVLRRSGHPTLDEISFKLIYHLSQALNTSDQYKKIINKINLNSIVQSETQFIPSAIIFQYTLANKKKVYSRDGSKKMSIKKFSSFSERYTSRQEIPDQVFKLIYKNSRKLASKLGNKLVKNRFSGSKKEEDLSLRDSKWAHQNKKNYSKNDICKIFNWDVNKPIVLIFSHSLIDGNISCGSRIFKDNLTWLRETLLEIKNIDKFNWMIKPHPMDWYYEFSKTTTENEYKKIAGKTNHIKICPKNISSISLSKIAKAIVTSHGSVSAEYVCLGVPAISAGRAGFGDININYRAKTKKKYFYYLNNINKLSGPNKTQIDKARIYSYIHSSVIRTHNNLLPKFANTRDVDQNKFFQDCNKLIKKYPHYPDEFKKMAFHQFRKNDPQTVNLNVLHKVLKIKGNKKI
jgi:hypothetical protein